MDKINVGLCIGCYKHGHFENNLCDVCHTTLDKTSNNPAIDKGSKYIKPITGNIVSLDKENNRATITVDVYDVLKAFNITCPALAHAIKKLLCAGNRGHKDTNTDLNEAINSIHRAKELLDV